MEKIALKKNNHHLILNRIGGGIAEYYLMDGSTSRNIVYGYKDDESKSGSMGDVLFPFPGRVENSQYTFNNITHTLVGLRIKDGNAIHGFAKTAEWEIVEMHEADATLRFVMKKEEYAKKGFPFELSLILKYELHDHGFTCFATVENTSNEEAPFGLGFHPYFTVGTETINNMHLDIAAQKLVECAPNLKPTGHLTDPKDTELDFSFMRPIGKLVIDNCFTELLLTDGITKTMISDGHDRTITVWQDASFPYLQVYSADTIGEEHARKGLALEPQTCTGFALNMPEMGLRVLKPREVFNGKWGVLVS